MNHTTHHTEFEDIYDAIQTGEIPRPALGDTINSQYIVVDKLGNFNEVKFGEQYYLFTETVRNNSTGFTFDEQYVATQRCPLDAQLKHLETIAVEQTPITLA